MKRIPCLLFIMFFFSGSLVAQNLDKWEIFKSNHFLVYYKKASTDFVKDVSDKSEEYYNQIEEDLGFSRLNFWSWDERAKIYIYDDSRDYQVQTGKPAWSQGAALPGAKIIQSFVGAKDFLETTLPHEVSHIVFREFVGFNNPAIPLWLDEGVASFQEKARYNGANETLREKIEENEFIDLTKLSSFKVYPTNYGNDAIRLFYMESFSLVEFLINSLGKDKFVTFCRDLRDKMDLESALTSSYNFTDLKDLNQAWQTYIRNE